jgi:hypothetical protein
VRLGLRIFLGLFVASFIGVTAAAVIVARDRAEFERTMSAVVDRLGNTSSVPAFVAPASGALSTATVARYLDVRAALDVAFAKLPPFPARAGRRRQRGCDTSRARGARAQHTFTFWPVAADAFSATLSEHAMSLAEYTWSARRFPRRARCRGRATRPRRPACCAREQRTAFALRKDHTEEELWNSIVTRALAGAGSPTDDEIALAQGAVPLIRTQTKAPIADLLVLQVLPEFAPKPSSPNP